MLAVCLSEVVRLISKAIHLWRYSDFVVLVTLCSLIVDLQSLMKLLIVALLIISPLDVILRRVLLRRNQDPVVHYRVRAFLRLGLETRRSMSGTQSC